MERNTSNTQAREKLKAVWSYDYKKILLEIAVEEVHKGNRPTTTFNQRGYDNIINEFHKRTGLKYEKVQFKNIFQSMRNEYKEWKIIKRRSGLGWDPDKNSIVATEDEWKDYIKMHPNAKIFKKGPLQFEDELAILFDGTTAFGEDAFCSTQGESLASQNHENLDDTNTPNIEIDDLTNDDGNRIRKRKRQSEHPRTKKDTFRGEIQEAIASLVDIAKFRLLRESTTMAPTVTPPSNSPPPSTQDNNQYTIALKRLEEMEEERIRRMQSVFNRGRNKYKKSYESWRENDPGTYNQNFQRDDWYWKADTSFKDKKTKYKATPRESGSFLLSHHYSVLGLQRSRTKPYTDVEIKTAFRVKAKELHPDQNQDNKEAAEEKFKEVLMSYEAIKLERKNAKT